jgi:hypothetical protein
LRNDLGLYDLKHDPDEMNNLATPEKLQYNEALLLTMNQKLNILIHHEIGDDKALLKKPVLSLATSFFKKRLSR